MRTIFLLGIFLLWAFTNIPGAYASDDDGEKERSFVASVAATVYAAAWPTATYKDWSYQSCERVPGGGDLVVRLKGESAFGGDLWIDLLFEFRKGGFSDLAVHEHNAVLVPPFETIKTLGSLTMELVNEYSEDNSPPAPATVDSTPAVFNPPAAYVRTTRQVRVASQCNQPLSLWMQTFDSHGQLQTIGPWPVQATSSTILADSANVLLGLSDASVNYYAEIANANYVWSGERQVIFGNRTLPMRSQALPLTPDGVYELNLDCSTLALPVKQPARFVGVRGRDVNAVQLRGITFGGAQVTGLMRDYPAALAGLQVNDVITEIDGLTIRNMAHMQEIIAGAGSRTVLVTAQRADGPRHFTLASAPAPIRQPVDHAQCRERGNPPDYYLGAVAAPFTSATGESVVPLYPETEGRLFDPAEVDLYYHNDRGLYFFFGKPLRDDIQAFEYYDLDRAVLAVLASGQRLDLGVRIQCLVHSGLMLSANVHLSRTQGGKIVSERVVALNKR